MDDVALLKSAKFTGYYAIPEGVWFATYDPDEDGGNLLLHFDPNEVKTGRESYQLRVATSDSTGAEWFILDGKNYTIDGLTAVGRFTIPLSHYLVGKNQSHWFYGSHSIKPFEAMLSARGDTASAKKLRDTFPKLFQEPTPQPVPQPTSQPRVTSGFLQKLKQS